jgi:hypothetical protein
MSAIAGAVECKPRRAAGPLDHDDGLARQSLGYLVGCLDRAGDPVAAAREPVVPWHFGGHYL